MANGRLLDILTTSLTYVIIVTVLSYSIIPTNPLIFNVAILQSILGLVHI